MRIGAGCSIFRLLASLAGKIGMHDFILAKEIIDEVLKIAYEKNLRDIQSVSVSVGSVALSHDGMAERAEDISLENLEFGLKSIAEKTALKNTKFIIYKTDGEHWKITNIEVK